MIDNYEKYLKHVGKTLENFFVQQQPYIHCKEGCSICCETGEYPFSKLEFEYAMIGYNNLSEEEKNVIKDKVNQIKIDKKNSTDTKFMHECPFLINKKCCIYKYRGLICRTHGLMYFETDDENNTKYKMPSCVNDGLNYSEVYDLEQKTISSARWSESKIETEPLSYNISLKAMMNNSAAKTLELDFGEQKALIDWFEDYT